MFIKFSLFFCFSADHCTTVKSFLILAQTLLSECDFDFKFLSIDEFNFYLKSFAIFQSKEYVKFNLQMLMPRISSAIERWTW